MTIKMSLAIPGGAIEISAANQKELIEEAAFWQSLPHTCPICGTETRLYYKEPNGFSYYGLICTNPQWPRHEMNCGQHKEGGTMFVKDVWQYWDPEQQRAIVVWENGRPTNRGVEAQPVQNGKPATRQLAPPEPPPPQNDNPFDGALPAQPLLKQFDDLGMQIYSTQWPEVRAHNTERISEGKTKDATQLSDDQLQSMIDGMKTLQRKRQKVAA